jgi:K+-transporting ATPase c subunit
MEQTVEIGALHRLTAIVSQPYPLETIGVVQSVFYQQRNGTQLRLHSLTGQRQRDLESIQRKLLP